jgi:hypothetical protein
MANSPSGITEDTSTFHAFVEALVSIFHASLVPFCQDTFS